MEGRRNGRRGSARTGSQVVGIPGLQARPLGDGTSIVTVIVLVFRPLRPADRRILRGFLPPVDGQVEQAVSRRCAQSRGGLGHGLQRVELNRFRASKADQLKRRPLVAQARLGALNPVRVGRFGSGRASLAHAGQAEKVGHHQPEGSHSKDQVTNAVAAAAIHATPPKGHRRLLRNLMGLHEDNARPASRFRLATNPAPVSVGAIPSFCHFTCPGGP
jgi:hypothetical protein